MAGNDANLLYPSLSVWRLYKPGRHGTRSAHDTMESCPLSVNLPRNSMATWVHVARDCLEPHGTIRSGAWSCACMAAHELLTARIPPWARWFHGRLGPCSQGMAREHVHCLCGSMSAWSYTCPAPTVVSRLEVRIGSTLTTYTMPHQLDLE